MTVLGTVTTDENYIVKTLYQCLRLSVTHVHSFDSAEQLAAFVGIVPVERQSGSSVLGRARLSRLGSARIRAVLYMVAIGAAMRKLLHSCFGVLKTRKSYQDDYAKDA